MVEIRSSFQENNGHSDHRGANAPVIGNYAAEIGDTDGVPAEILAANSVDTSQILGESATASVIAEVPPQLLSTTNALGPVTIQDGATAEIDGASSRQVVFEGATGELNLDDAPAYTGSVFGLAGSDSLDLAGISFGVGTTATYLGNTSGGVLTVSDGTHTANIDLVGNYLSSTWDLSSDGHGGTVVVDPVAPNNWQTLKVGAGGFVDGLDIAPDGTMVVRTDTFGAYIWNGSAWQQLVTATSMPTTTGAPGVYEIQIAPSNSNILYMMYEGYVFQSTNKGTTWTQTNFAQVYEDAFGGNAYRMDGQKMAVDPNNPNVVYAGTQQNGLFVTADGGATWQSVSQVPVSHTDGSGYYPGITGIEFDPALGTTAGKTNTIFAASYGNGVYESTNAGSSWSSIGGPSDVVYAAVSSTGTYYAVDGTSLWSFAAGHWTQLVSNSVAGMESVAVNPANPNEIVTLSPAGYINVSYDGGTTWSGLDYSGQVSSTDIPWLASAVSGSNGTSYLDVGGLAFNPSVPNELIATGGTGVWTSNFPTNLQWTTPVSWNDQSLGIEQLVANEIIVPPGGNPVLASWDRPFFYISNPNAYPSTYGPVSSGNIVAGWSIDYASSNPSFVVGIADWWGTEESGYSTNGGQTWTAFPSFIPGAGTNFMGGTIAASTPENIIWAPADEQQPYYTLDGGKSWNPITLPGVSSWSNFDWAYYLDARTVTADRVLPNTFYLYYAGEGLYESTNGGVSWTQMLSGQITTWSNYNAELQSVPGEAGNLFFTAGPQSGGTQTGFWQSTNQGAAWTAVPNVQNVNCFGFGAPAPGQSYPSIYIVGWVNNVFGIWQSNDDAKSWVQIGTYPENSLDGIKTISGDPNVYGQVYVGFAGSGYAYLPIITPIVTAVTTSPATGVEVPGNTITLTLTMSEAVTVAGTPTLSLNDGGTASYIGGSGTSALTFSYTVSASDTAVSTLAITQVNEPNGATVTDSKGNNANFASAVKSFSGLEIHSPSGPTLTSMVDSPSSGDLDAGKTVTLTLNLSEAVTVAGGTPTLTLNDGGTATYSGGSGSSALTFSYTVAAGQNTGALAATAVNLNSASITDGSGNAAHLSLSGLTQSGPQIDTTTPTVTSVVDSPASADLGANQTVTLTLNTSEIVTVAGGTPTLTLNDGGTATYTGGSGSNALTFSYTVGAGQNTASLAATTVNLHSATITDNAGNAANLSLSGLTQSGPQIDTTTPRLAIDGNGFSNQSTVLPSASVTLTTASANDVIILNIVENGSAIASVSDTAGLTWQERAVAGTSPYPIYQYYAIAPHALSADSITVNFTSSPLYYPYYVDLHAFGISGANTSSPFDTNASIPATSNNSTVSATTSNANDLIFAAYRLSAPTASAGSGWTAIGASADNYLSEYQIVSTTQSGLVATASLATGQENGGIIDAVVQAAATQPIGPTVSSVSTTTGDYDAGKVLTLTLAMSENVTVTGTPTLMLNDGGTATYTGGSGTSTLTFNYTVVAGQNTTAPQVTAVNGTITDAGGNTLNTANLPETFSGVTIDTTMPVISAIAELPSSGDLNAGKTVAYTLTMSEVVTVNGGSPTLSLNDGGTATYVSGSGSNALTFSYTVLAGQNTPDLMVTAFDLNGATVLDGAGNAANLSLSGVVQGSPAVDTTAPTTPVISSESIVNTNQVILTGTALDQGNAEAGDLIRVYDGATLLGTTTTDATGAWSYTTAPLLDGSHALTATVTDLAGNTSVASQAVNPVIAPPAPAIASFSPHTGSVAGVTDANVLSLTGTAAASSTVTLYDGTTSLGTATADGSGNWTFTTATLVDGTHNFTATDTVSGATSAASAALAVSVDTVAPAAPVITSDTIVNTDQVTVTGSALDQGIAEAGDLVKVYDGTTLLGTTTTNATGAWNYTTAPLSAGTHALTATVTDVAGNTSVVSQAVDPAIAPPAPPAPAIAAFSPDTGSVAGITDANVLTLTGTADANTTVSIYDGSTLLGTTSVNGSGAWSFTTAKLSDGTHSFTATDTAASAVTSTASSVFNVTVDTAAPTASFSSDVKNSNGSFTLSGTALDKGTVEAGDTIKIYDGTTYLGSTTVGSNGQWSFKTAPLSNAVHYFNSTVTDIAGNVGPSTGDAIYGYSDKDSS